MSHGTQPTFQFTTPAIEVERAVAELRFGRPVLLSSNERKLAVLALDAVAPSIYDQFAMAVDNKHSLLLTAPRATRLGIVGSGDILTPLAGVSFEQASRLSYVLGAERPSSWMKADDLSSQTAELARIALLLPAMVMADVSASNERFAGCCELAAENLKGADVARQRFEQVVRTRVPLKDLGDSEFVVFRGGLAQKDQVAIVVGKPDVSRTVPVRIHSSCITGDLCGSLKCDCGDQLRNGLALLKQAGGGVLLYLDQEGRGTGIGAKMRAYGYQHLGLDTIDADAELGLAEDHRRYESAVSMLRHMNISKVAVYTNNPTKISALRAGGIEVDARAPVTGTVTAENQNYLRTKTLRAGHMMDLKALVAAE
ncbi:GTP cyclohydrolase II RibA [Agrobacterium larrymoorei]|uniref:GTP cyclohydrolase-2 n=1 Tax=Agrobacterium larrymoorei TaxID=160699 RepID=A0A4D7DPW8_9HYPH|nr:GTP cyclohydrolase II RibA [Agrobacterium larrymoorei]QCI99443.1 GTP cyclohydrolase II RibA [Agrobacterium larrymoorei]QYA08987.1 GTP cyclohydrolase II RibA [Agrobacterium larrymoorei]